MKQIKSLVILLVGGLLIASCSKQIEEKQTDPNKPAAVPPQLVLGTVLTDISGTASIGALSGFGSSEGVNSWDGVHRWNQYHCSNYDYYDNQIYSWTNGNFDAYLVLTDVLQMEHEVTSRGGNSVNPYEAIGRFARAYYFYNMTMLYGDIPLGDALKSPKIFTPKYETQENVFKYVLAQLDTANSDLASLIGSLDKTLSTTQDIYYSGSLSAWQKLVNSFKLRVLIQLSPKVSDAALNVPAQFAAILADPVKYPVFTSQKDDFQFVYNPGGSNTFSTYPFNPSNFGSVAGRFNMAKTYVDACTGIKDPRVFITCDPAWALVGKDSLNPAQYQYFAGASTGEPLATMYNNANNNLYSFISRKRYYQNFTGDPDVLVGYKELCLNIAEGMVRGWVPGKTTTDAETWYKLGITESMSFYGIDITKTDFTAYFLPPGKSDPVNEVAPYPFTFKFDDYYAQPGVKLSTNTATAVNEINLQKYIVFFQNSGYEPYYNWRRTGTPAFLGGSGVGNNGVVPVRRAYPVSEQAVNAANYQAAIAAQGWSGDDLNQKIWLLK